MPRKCCTFYDGKSCHSNYDETKGRQTIGGVPVNLKMLIRLLSEKSTRNSPENL